MYSKSSQPISNFENSVTKTKETDENSVPTTRSNFSKSFFHQKIGDLSEQLGRLNKRIIARNVVKEWRPSLTSSQMILESEAQNLKALEKMPKL